MYARGSQLKKWLKSLFFCTLCCLLPLKKQRYNYTNNFVGNEIKQEWSFSFSGLNFFYSVPVLSTLTLAHKWISQLDQMKIEEPSTAVVHRFDSDSMSGNGSTSVEQPVWLQADPVKVEVIANTIKLPVPDPKNNDNHVSRIGMTKYLDWFCKDLSAFARLLSGCGTSCSLRHGNSISGVFVVTRPSPIWFGLVYCIVRRLDWAQLYSKSASQYLCLGIIDWHCWWTRRPCLDAL